MGWGGAESARGSSPTAAGDPRRRPGPLCAGLRAVGCGLRAAGSVPARTLTGPPRVRPSVPTGPYAVLTKDTLPQTYKRKRSWSRAVFSNLQRKGLEKRFEIQKYVTKPDRKQLAAMLGLTDAQVWGEGSPLRLGKGGVGGRGGGITRAGREPESVFPSLLRCGPARFAEPSTGGHLAPRKSSIFNAPSPFFSSLFPL